MKFQWRKRLFQKKETKDSKEKQNHEEIKQHRLAFIAAVVCSVVVGITGAWLVNRANIATLFTVSKPSTIAVKGPNGEEMAQLDLSYTDADKDKNGKVTIKRVISVVSDQSEHKIEIAHTTNLKGLNFEVYKANVTKDSTTGQYIKINQQRMITMQSIAMRLIVNTALIIPIIRMSSHMQNLYIGWKQNLQ